MPKKIDGITLFHKLAARGYTIIPIAPCSKVPSKYHPDSKTWIPYKGWSQLQNDNSKIDIWCSWPAPGVGSTTGEQIVIDLDTMYEPLRDDMLIWLKNNNLLSPLQRQGKAPKLALIYRTNDHITKLYSRAFTIEGTKNQIEVLGHGQQYIMYGVHPDTKQPYTWLGQEPLDIDFKDLPLITAKQIEELIAEFERLATTYDGIPVSAGLNSNETHISSTSLSDKRGLAAAALATIPNDDLHYDEWIKVGMATKAAFQDDEGTGLELWLEFSEKASKSNSTLSAEKWETFNPKKIGAATLYYLAQQHGWVNPNPTAQSNPEDDFDAIPDTSPAKKPRLHFLHMNDIKLDTAREALIDDYLDQNTLSIMYGESNSGKTFAALDMAFHIAAGLPWNGKNVKQGAAFYVAAEGGRGVLDRVLALKKQHGLTEDDYIPLFIAPCGVDLRTPNADTKPLIDAILSYGIPAAIIVIDTLSRALAGGNENDSVDMGSFVKNCDKIRETTKAAVMIIHHSGKDTAKGARGHSLLRAAVDTEFEIAEDQLRTRKQRDMEMLAPLPFKLRVQELGVNHRGKALTSCTVEWGAVILSDTTNAQDIDYRQLDLLMGLKAAHAQIPAAESIQRKLWFETTFQSGIWPQNLDTAKRYMERAKNILIDKKYVSAGVKNGFKLLRVPDRKHREIDIFS